MSDRLVPVLAAMIGLLGGMGGAAIGGYVANKGEDERLKQERASEIRDLRIDTYVRFLRAAELEYNAGPATEDALTSTAEAEVSLVTPSAALRETASELTASAFDGQNELEYQRLREEFIGAAQAGTGLVGQP
jgi:hypothetical protein